MRAERTWTWKGRGVKRERLVDVRVAVCPSRPRGPAQDGGLRSNTRKSSPRNEEKIPEIAVSGDFSFWVFIVFFIFFQYLFNVEFSDCGELLGMEWHNVDWEKSTIRIEKNVPYMPQRSIYVDTPKIETSKRKISLPSRMMTLLKEYKDWVDIEKERIGWSWNSGNDFIFTSETGDLLHPDTVSK